VVLGAGAGWLKQEFELTRQDFHRRGRHFDESLAVLKTLLSGGMVEFHGEFYDFHRLQMEPLPSQPVPICIGGNSDAALRRAARHDGLFCRHEDIETELLPLLERYQRTRAALGTAQRPPRIAASLTTGPNHDDIQRMEEIGVTTICVDPWYFVDGPNTSLEHKRASMLRFAETYIHR